MCVCFAGLGLQLPTQPHPENGRESPLSAFRPDTACWSHGQTGPAHLQRGLTTGSRGREGSGPPPRSAAEPRAGPAVLGMGLKREPVVPGPQRHGSSALRPRKRKDTSRGGGGDTRRGLSLEQSPPWEPNRRRTLPERAICGPGPPGASTRPPPAQPGPYGSPPLVSALPPPRGQPATPSPTPPP